MMISVQRAKFEGALDGGEDPGQAGLVFALRNESDGVVRNQTQWYHALNASK